jgi:hypothetical protein
MYPSFKQPIAVGLLCILAWSCSGLGFGMFGHGLMEMSGVSDEHHSTNTVSECCEVLTQSTGDMTATNMDHQGHEVAILTLVSLLTVLFVRVLQGSVTVRVLIRLQLYARTWGERWAYFALYFNTLFSRGILHSKTW